MKPFLACLFPFLLLFSLASRDCIAQRKANLPSSLQLDSLKLARTKNQSIDSSSIKSQKRAFIFFSRGEASFEGLNISNSKPNDFSPQQWVRLNASQSFSIKGLPFKAGLTLSSENSRFNRVNSFSLEFDYMALKDSIEARRKQKEQQFKDRWTKSKAEKSALLDRRKALQDKISKLTGQINGAKPSSSSTGLPLNSDSTLSELSRNEKRDSKQMQDSLAQLRIQSEAALNKWVNEKELELSSLKDQEELFNSQIANLERQGQLDSLQMELQSPDAAKRRLAQTALNKFGSIDNWVNHVQVEKFGLGMVSPNISMLSVQNVLLNGGEFELGLHKWRLGAFAGKTGGNRGFLNPIRPIPFSMNQWAIGLHGGFKSDKDQLLGVIAVTEVQASTNGDQVGNFSNALWNTISALYGKKNILQLVEIEAEIVHAGVGVDYKSWANSAIKQYSQFRNYAGRLAFRTATLAGFELNGQWMQINPGFINRLNGLLRRDIRQLDLALEKVLFNRVRAKLGFRRLDYDVLAEGNVGRNIQSAKLQVSTMFKRFPNLTIAYTPYTTLNQIDGKQYWADINNWLIKLQYIRKLKKWRFNSLMQYAGNETIMDTLSNSSSQGLIQAGLTHNNGFSSSISYFVSQFKPTSDSSISDGITFQFGLPIRKTLLFNFNLQTSTSQTVNSFRGIGSSLMWYWSKRGSLQYQWQWNQWSEQMTNQNNEHRLRLSWSW